MTTPQLADIDIHQFLKIYQMNGFTRQLSENSDMWSYVKKLTEMDAQARSVRYLLINELGYGAVQALAADGSGTYPSAQRSGLIEPEAVYKEWGWTVDVPRVLENKTGSDLMQYAKPLATELDNKQIAFARLKCIEFNGDGSGAIGKLEAAPAFIDNSGAGKPSQLSFVVSHDSAEAGRSFVRWFQEGDIVKFAAPDSTAKTATGGGSEFKIVDINDTERKVTVESTGADITEVGSVALNDYVYRRGTTPAVLTDLGIAAGTTDYSSLTEVMAGLETLSANDNRKIHGMNMSGSTKGTRRDLDNAVIDSKHFQQLLSELKRKAGKGRYKYDAAFMADEVYDSLVESRETDRRFHDISDTDRGAKGIGYVHGKDRVEFMPDEFNHSQRIWLPPQGKDALCYIGKDAMQVKPNGSDPFHLSLESGAYGRNMETFFEQSGVAISKHPRAIGCLEKFKVSN